MGEDPRVRRRTAVIAVTLVTAVGALTQCAARPVATEPATTPVTTSPAPTTTSTSPVTTSAAPPQAARAAEVAAVSTADLGASWRPGCPIDPAQLRRVDLDYIGFDGQTQRGSLIVNAELVGPVIDVFEELYRLRYPIEKMRTVEQYRDADDELSMADNNTSAFNCRDIPGTGCWSWHASGRAIDINPLLNPYIDARGGFQPANAGPYLDRTRADPGLLHDGDPAVLAFTDRGWRWGGHWRTPIDYQHFELP
ncbi:MAG: M15 family metallopeptidase [Actinobacteria bacterium]|nr:M15 family metallopeptidase [Actinomycetota bacterium]